QAVDAVARRQSIRQAAAGLAISPSALNRQILSLEEELGVELFERLPRGVRLSTAGEVYLRSFRAHLADLERAQSQIADLSGMRVGAVRFGVAPELASHFAPRVAAAYRRAYPQVDLRIIPVSCENAPEALRGFDVDVIAAVNPIMDETVETIHAEEVSIACVGGDLGEGAEDIRLSDLHDRSLIAHTEASGLRRLVDAAFAARGTRPRYAVVSDRYEPEMLRADASMTQMLVSPDADRSAAERDGLALRAMRNGDAPTAFAKVLRLRARKLPVASDKFAERVAAALSAEAVA
ncbi:MAG: LysR family transcriptional regulator, partial [Pseudomonadota bacterium]